MPVPRRRALKNKPLVAAALLTMCGVILSGVGVYAGLNAVATGTESINSGTISLTLGHDGNSAGFPETVSNMAPGDVYNTYVTLTNGSSSNLAAQNIALAVTGSPTTSTLITPPSADGTTGLEVSVTQCSVAWTVTTGTPGSASCGGTSTTLISADPVSSLSSAAPLISGAVAAGAVYHLQVSLTLPSSLVETTTNGTTPATSIQGQSVALTYTFSESQRSATITNS